MGCFKLPKSLCKDIESLVQEFQWGYSGNSRKIHWTAWKKLCAPKSHRGLGFRDLENFNLALLGKQIWRLVHNKDSMFYKVFKARFFPNCSILDSGVKTMGSYAWQSVLKARDVIKQGAYWRIGDGSQVQIWGDKWLLDMSTKHIISSQKKLPNNAKVCDLIDEEGPSWIEERIVQEFLPYETKIILGIPLSAHRVPDNLIQAGTKSGRYITKSAYKMLSSSRDSTTPGSSNPSAQNTCWRRIWSLGVPNKIKHFICRACCESLPTKRNLFSRKVTRSATCDRCKEEIKDAIHALWGSQALKEVW